MHRITGIGRCPMLQRYSRQRLSFNDTETLAVPLFLSGENGCKSIMTSTLRHQVTSPQQKFKDFGDSHWGLPSFPSYLPEVPFIGCCYKDALLVFNKMPSKDFKTNTNLPKWPPLHLHTTTQGPQTLKVCWHQSAPIHLSSPKSPLRFQKTHTNQNLKGIPQK